MTTPIATPTKLLFSDLSKPALHIKKQNLYSVDKSKVSFFELKWASAEGKVGIRRKTDYTYQFDPRFNICM